MAGKLLLYDNELIDFSLLVINRILKGRKSTKDEQGTAALKTIELVKKLNGIALQVRVVENKEPNHFMLIFGGKIIVFQVNYYMLL